MTARRPRIAGRIEVLAGATLATDYGGVVANPVAGSGAIETAAGATLQTTYAGVMTNTLAGNGRFQKLGAGRLLLTGDNSAFAGETHVDAGVLSNNGRLGGAPANGGLLTFEYLFR